MYVKKAFDKSEGLFSKLLHADSTNQNIVILSCILLTFKYACKRLLFYELKGENLSS